MSEYSSERHETDEPINRLEAIRRLREAGIDIDYDDDMGQDDNDFLGNLFTVALENGLEPEELFAIAGIPVDKFGRDE